MEKVWLENNLSRYEGGWESDRVTLSPCHPVTMSHRLFSNLFIIHTYLPMKMEQSVPKRRRIKFIRRVITQKKAYTVNDHSMQINAKPIPVLSPIHASSEKLSCFPQDKTDEMWLWPQIFVLFRFTVPSALLKPSLKFSNKITLMFFNNSHHQTTRDSSVILVGFWNSRYCLKVK